MFRPMISGMFPELKKTMDPPPEPVKPTGGLEFEFRNAQPTRWVGDRGTWIKPEADALYPVIDKENAVTFQSGQKPYNTRLWTVMGFPAAIGPCDSKRIAT